MCGSAHFCNQKEEVGIIGDLPKILAYSLFPICGVTTSDGSHLHSLLAFVPLEQQRQVHGGFECLMWCEMTVVPGAFTIVFWAVGKGWIRLPMVADSMSRSGSVEELAMGPVHYGICITLGTLFFWKRIEALYCILPISFGDGFAAFFGPHVHGNRPLGWNPSKTWFGFIAFVACSFIGLVVYIAGF